MTSSRGSGGPWYPVHRGESITMALFLGTSVCVCVYVYVQ